jgi:hypothetical protein
MNYTQRWQLAVALKQNYPTPSETGDVMPIVSAADAPTAQPSGVGAKDSWIERAGSAFRNTFFNGPALVGVGAGLLVGGTAGYFLGKGSK